MGVSGVRREVLVVLGGWGKTREGIREEGPLSWI